MSETEVPEPGLPGDDLIEIRDPAVDAGEIMATIRARIRQRRAEMGYEARQFPTFGAATPLPAAEELPAALYHHLRQANRSYNQVETAPLLAPSPATRLPVLGRLWQLVRGQAHQLILFYVNRAATHQAGVNRHLVSAANELARLAQEQQRTIAALQAEVEALRAQRPE